MHTEFVKTPTGRRGNFLSRILLAVVCLFVSASVLAQTRTLTGTVEDEQGEPLAGVSVKHQGAKTGVGTDIDGRYSITVDNNTVLVFSYIGYEPKTVKVGNQSVINIVLKEDVKSLEDVVVVAYGAQKKSSSPALSPR